jgi:cytochrome b6-f complex iron-sulfur subunit
MVALIRTIFGLVLVPIISAVAYAVSRLHQGVGSARVTRRTFLRNTVLGSVGIVLLEIAGGFVYFFWPNKTGAFGKPITLPLTTVPAVGDPPYVNRDGKFYIINNEDGALALYWKCVHLGCTVPWNDGEGDFHCPCHGSVYDRHGNRIAGPAPRAMDLFPMTVEGSNVVVDTNPDKVIQRQHFEPDQATQLPSA